MSVLKRIKVFFYNFTFKRKLADLKKQPKKPVNFKSAHAVGILFDGTNSFNYDKVKGYAKQLEAAGKTVEVLGFVNESVKDKVYPFKAFNNKDLNWFEIPASKEVEYFINRKFDLLLGLHVDTHMPLEYVAALSNAGLKVGRVNKNLECYDLMIDEDFDPKRSLERLIDQVDYYVKMVNN